MVGGLAYEWIETLCVGGEEEWNERRMNNITIISIIILRKVFLVLSTDGKWTGPGEIEELGVIYGKIRWRFFPLCPERIQSRTRKVEEYTQRRDITCRCRLLWPFPVVPWSLLLSSFSPGAAQIGTVEVVPLLNFVCGDLLRPESRKSQGPFPGIGFAEKRFGVDVHVQSSCIRHQSSIYGQKGTAFKWFLLLATFYYYWMRRNWKGNYRHYSLHFQQEFKLDYRDTFTDKWNGTN